MLLSKKKSKLNLIILLFLVICIFFGRDSLNIALGQVTDPPFVLNPDSDPQNPNNPQINWADPLGVTDNQTMKYSADLLQELPGLEDFDPDQECAFGVYLGKVIDLILGIIAVLAVIMIVIGGIQYMSSELISAKEEGINKVRNAIFGILIALSAWLILNTINPNILNLCPKIDPLELSFDGSPEGTGSFTPINKNALTQMGINCPGSGGKSALASIAQSFNEKVTYSMEHRGTYDASIPTTYLDCSSYVLQVYSCAGLGISGSSTASMFPGSEVVSSITGGGTVINGIPLQIGDLIGWLPGQSPTSPYGHVVMYIGGGQFTEVSATNTKNINANAKPASMSKYASKFKHIIRIP